MIPLLTALFVEIKDWKETPRPDKIMPTNRPTYLSFPIRQSWFKYNEFLHAIDLVILPPIPFP